MFAKYRGIVCGIIAATLFGGIASAEEKEPVAVLELGGASAWNVQGSPQLRSYGSSGVRVHQELSVDRSWHHAVLRQQRSCRVGL